MLAKIGNRFFDLALAAYKICACDYLRKYAGITYGTIFYSIFRFQYTDGIFRYFTNFDFLNVRWQFVCNNSAQFTRYACRKEHRGASGVIFCCYLILLKPNLNILIICTSPINYLLI